MLQFLAYALLCLIWGSTWLVIKVGYGGLGPFNVAALRFVIAGSVFVFLIPALGARWPRGRTEWLLTLFIGTILFAADYGLIYWAEQQVDSGFTAIVFAVLPVMTSVAAHFYLETEPLTSRKLLGTIVAFVGSIVLFADRVAIETSQAWSMAAILGAAACATATILASKRYGGSLHAAGLNAPAMLIGAFILLLVALAHGEHLGLPSNASIWAAVLYLSIAGSVVTFLIYFWLLKQWAATTMSLVNVVTPLVAVWLGWIFRAEKLTPWTGVGGVLILSGVLFTTSKRKI